MILSVAFKHFDTEQIFTVWKFAGELEPDVEDIISINGTLFRIISIDQRGTHIIAWVEEHGSVAQ